MSAVAGDPASCSQLGGTLRRLAARLRSTGRAAHDAFDSGGEPRRPAPPLAAVARRFDAVDSAAAVAAAEVDRIGAALQAHASELAEAVSDARQVEARAQGAGLRVVDGAVVDAWGVTGVADPGATSDRVQQRTALQAELDAVVVVLARRRARLVETLEAASGLLAEAAATVRRRG